MAYLALARKYRPQRFADMIGQEHVTRTLENAIRTDRVHHAYLFCGVRGLGKTTAARILAKCLVCEQGPTPEPCNQCEQCVAINQGRSVDVIEIDGASNNSVDDIRALRDQVNYLPHSARRKIYIIDEVHMLSQQAFNALLKTLEEPPAHVTFMFATTDPHKVLPTILSRVSRLDYRRVRAATLVPYLQEILSKEGFCVDEEGLYVVARCGEGSVRDALTLLDKVIAFAEDPEAITTEEVLTVLGQASRYAVAELVGAILQRDAEAVLERFEAITSMGSDLMQLAVAILQHLRDLAVVKLTGAKRSTLLDMSDDLYDQLVAQAEGVEATIIAQHFDRFSRVIENVENARVPRLVIEMGLLELVNAEPLLPLGDLVARLDALGRGGAGGGRGGGGSRRPRAGAGGGDRGRGGGGRARAEGQAQAQPASAPPRPEPAREPRPAPVEARPAPVEARPAPVEARPAPVEARPASTRLERSRPEPAAPRPGPEPARASAAASDEEQISKLEALARNAGLLPGGPEPAKTGPSQASPSHRRGGPGSRSQVRTPRTEPANGRQRPRDSAPERAAAEPPPDHPAFAADPSTSPRPPGAEGRDEDFELTNKELPPAANDDPEAGCPSSRCLPREAIAWRELETWDAWEMFLSRVREENDLLWALLLDLGLLKIAPGLVELAAPATGFAQTQLRENPELKVAFEHLTGVYFGESMRLELVDATPSLPDMPSLALVDAERRRRHHAEVERDAQSHPRIRALLRTFGGELTQIEPLEGPALPPIGQRGLPRRG